MVKPFPRQNDHATDVGVHPDRQTVWRIKPLCQYNFTPAHICWAILISDPITSTARSWQLVGAVGQAKRAMPERIAKAKGTGPLQRLCADCLAAGCRDHPAQGCRYWPSLGLTGQVCIGFSARTLPGMRQRSSFICRRRTRVDPRQILFIPVLRRSHPVQRRLAEPCAIGTPVGLAGSRSRTMLACSFDQNSPVVLS